MSARRLSQREQVLLAEVRRAVRVEIRQELILAGVLEHDAPLHWEQAGDREALAQRLRGIAEQLDPRGRR